LSVTLLAGAALLITSFVRLTQQNIGFHAENRWIGFLTLPTAQYPDAAARQRFVEQTLTALHNASGLESVTISSDIPLLAGAGSNILYSPTNGEILPLDKRQAAALHNIAPDYLKTWGIPLLAGREFDPHDTVDSQPVILISQAGAKKIFGDENPIGKTLLIGSSNTTTEIEGVVGAVRSRKESEADALEGYRAWAQPSVPFPVIVATSKLRPDTITKLVRSALATVDPGLAIALPQPMTDVVAQALGQTRLMVWLLGIFAGVALLLAS